MSEIQEEYRVSTQLPTLTELEALKAQYLAQGYSLFEDLALVVKEMGEYQPIAGRDRWTLDEGRIHAAYITHTNGFLFLQGAFSVTRSLYVSMLVGRQRVWVCSIVMTTSPNPSRYEDPANNIYIPGRWEQVLLSHLAAAKAAIQQREAESDMSRRAWLANQLLIGKEV